MVEVFFPTRQECRVPVGGGARLVVTIEMVDGVPKVTWSPDLGAERVYRVLGAKGLVTPVAPRIAPPSELASLGGYGDSDGTVWEVVTEETKGDYNFFKVAVEMP